MRLPFVISVPHCSSLIPSEIRPLIVLSEREILESTDLGTREIFTHLPVRVSLWSRWSRLVVDLNRDPLQRDPRGVIPEEDYFGRKVYDKDYRPEKEEAERRLQTYYWPYHHRLREAIQDPEAKILFDCHSLAAVGPPGAPDPLKWRKDVVLGNNGNHKGAPDPSLGKLTCPTETLQTIKAAFVSLGFSVSINQPYSGGFITTHYGGDLIKQDKMAVQIEINQELYLDGQRLQIRRDDLADISKRLHQVFREIARRI